MDFLLQNTLFKVLILCNEKTQWLIYSLQTELSLEYDKSLGGNTSNLNVSKPYIEGNIVSHIVSERKLNRRQGILLYLNFF